ncbi:MAG: WD40 repeat domain-containing serine/threonine protein kinase, partial [Gemmataceae bacterium]
MDTREVIARFEAERQALAMMDHPNIAKVLDAGATDKGRPFFVMELVKGVPITAFCDEHRLPPRRRLELFVAVCQAVQHAHQKGVIHRDLKPSNVLVALYDGKPVPKVIDFGVAKAAGAELTDKTLFTGFGSVVGTLEYMSPEQAELNNLDIDTRSDVYALGVMMYELLTGSTPLESGRLKSTSLLEALRLIREEEPLTPSTRLSTASELPALADRRGVEQRALSGLLRGEVDWIVMKCLEKDRSRRYETASALARDLERYLGDEPVLACPPSVGYRLRKFARRNRAALAMIAVVVAGLLLAVVGLAVSTLLIWRAKGQAEQALEGERRSAYWQRIALAERELGANNLQTGQAQLDRCPEPYRGWEWHHLRRASGKAVPPLRHDYTVCRLAISPDGRRVVCPDAGGFVTVWDVATGGRLLRFRGHERLADRVAFSPDGGSFVTVTFDPSARTRCEVKVWDAFTGKPLASWAGPRSGVGGMAFSPDGRLACSFTDEGQDGTTDLRDPRTGRVLLPLGTAKGGSVGLAFTPCGRRLAEATEGGEVHLWDLAAARRVRSFPAPRPPVCMALSADGQLLAVGCGEDGEAGGGRVLVWESDTGRQRLSLAAHHTRSLAFSPDGTRLASGGTDQAVNLWDVASGQEILTLRG